MTFNGIAQRHVLHSWLVLCTFSGILWGFFGEAHTWDSDLLLGLVSGLVRLWCTHHGLWRGSHFQAQGECVMLMMTVCRQ